MSLTKNDLLAIGQIVKALLHAETNRLTSIPSNQPSSGALSVPQFCERYSVSKGMVFKLIRDGKLQRAKAGRRTLIPIESAEAWWSGLDKEASK